jgi:hypothetical protein
VTETPDDEFTWPPSDEDRADFLHDLKEMLAAIEEHDEDYEPRYALVFLALAFAAIGGLEAGIRIDPNQPDWPVAYIELPTGQCSWHLPVHKREHDRHTTPEKYERIRAWIGGTS